MKVKIRYENFWIGFDNNNNFLTRLFRYGEREQDLESLNLTCRSVFPRKEASWFKIYKKLKHCIKLKLGFDIQKPGVSRLDLENSKERILWYTGENVRPPVDVGMSLSFDFDDYSGKNLYYPLIYDTLIQSILGDVDEIFGARIDFEPLVKGRILQNGFRKDFCTFINNLTPIREYAVSAIKQEFNLDLFGSISGNYLKRKIDISSTYKYILCFENDSYPGYVTEKLLHAYALNGVPVYWGDLGKEENINRKAFVNVSSFRNLDEAVKFLKSLRLSDYKEIYEQPLFSNVPNYGSYSNFIIQKFKSGVT